MRQEILDALSKELDILFKNHPHLHPDFCPNISDLDDAKIAEIARQRFPNLPEHYCRVFTSGKSLTFPVIDADFDLPRGEIAFTWDGYGYSTLRFTSIEVRPKCGEYAWMDYNEDMNALVIRAK